jgi:hypothetical protein
MKNAAFAIFLVPLLTMSAFAGSFLTRPGAVRFAAGRAFRDHEGFVADVPQRRQ